MTAGCSLVVLALTAGCQPAAPSLPWLHGLGEVVASTEDVTDVGDLLAEGCGAGASRTLRLVADVTGTPALETVTASYSGGLVVTDAEHHVLARGAGYPCEGSADELDTLAVGGAYGHRTVVIAATAGGRRETATWVGLFRPGFGGALDPVFTGEVERRVGDVVERGNIWLVPDGLLHQPPGGPTSYWPFDPVGHAYVPYGPLERREPPHVPIVDWPTT
ncbi:MAG: hypothetical protein M3680_09680 [Myxococcota bacterium]|nr:hypothetical protein [Myxococcota bacterium]